MSFKLNSGWLAARVGDVQHTGIELTTTHPPSSPWMEAVVPGTILTTLLKNKLIPDPFYGMENEQIIDIADAGREYYTFWFFTSFNLSLDGNDRAWLQFRAINYQAEVFLNGHQHMLPKGMFRRHILDITELLKSNGPNLLAVLVHPPDHPGRIPLEGGQGGDHDISKDVAAQYVEGWDWMAPIRDRNTGIWDEVCICKTGPIKICDPHLVGVLSEDFKKAYLHISTELTNASSRAMDCVLKVQVSIGLESNILSIEHFKEQELVIPGGTTVSYTLSPLFFHDPLLWWPNGMGEQHLYQVSIIIEVRGYGESDTWSHPFGLRKIESCIDPSTGGRLFKVNGELVFIRGGNWIVSDGLLRLSEKRYRSDIDFHADMNFNMIRCWGGAIAERPEFYLNCDRRGLLVWQEFWITGDCNGRGTPPSDCNWPLDHQLFLLCARDTIKLLRNHTSLALWVGGNEQRPADDINAALMQDLQLHPFFESTELPATVQSNQAFVDPSCYLDGTRLYIQGSLWDGFAKGNGDFSDGPYRIQNPEDFFKEDFYSYGFNPEVGSVGTPVSATIKATMPPEAWQPPELVRQPDGYIKECPNSTWEYHTYIPYSEPGKVHDQIEIYGKPKELDDFCGKAQLVNFVQYRALMEGWASRMWTKYTGVLIWKNQNPWTGLRGQLYDHLHDQTGGFFGVRSACEPIHVQLNLANYFIEVVNTTAKSLTNVNVEATVWDLDGACPYHEVAEHLTLPSKNTLVIFEMKYPKLADAKNVYFLLLKLFDESCGNLISRNFYWLHLPGGNFKALDGIFKLRTIPLQVTIGGFLSGKTCRVNVEVANCSSGADVGTQFRKKREGQAVLEPWNDHETCAEMGIEHKFSVLLHHVANSSTVEEENPYERTKTTQTSDYSGVAFWLHFSVLSESEDLQSGDDARILPVNYSQNYFSLAPGESMDVEMFFELPEGTKAKLIIDGWNITRREVSLQFTGIV